MEEEKTIFDPIESEETSQENTESTTSAEEIVEQDVTETTAAEDETLAEDSAETTASEEVTAEQDSTVVLREDYESKQEINAKAKKTKKKLGKGKLTLIIIGSILAAIILAVGLFLGISKLVNKPIITDDLVLNPAKPAFANTISAELKDKLDAALLKSATTEQKAEAAMELFALANQNKKNAEKCVMIAQGSGSAVVGGLAEGQMSVRAFKVQDNGVYYYEKGAKLTDVNMGTVDLLSGVLDQQERAYDPGDGGICRTAALKGASAQVGETFSETLPFLDLKVTDRKGNYYDEYLEEYDDYDEFLTDSFTESGDPKEINNFHYRKEGIKDITLSYDAEQGLYVMTFVVDVKDEVTVRVARGYLRKSSNSENLEFNQLTVTVKIWDNGYIRSFNDTEEWAGDAKVEVGPVKASGESRSTTWYEAAFYWDYDSLVADKILDPANTEIKKDTYTADIIRIYATEAGWLGEEE